MSIEVIEIDVLGNDVHEKMGFSRELGDVGRPGVDGDSREIEVFQSVLEKTIESGDLRNKHGFPKTT